MGRADRRVVYRHVGFKGNHALRKTNRMETGRLLSVLLQWFSIHFAKRVFVQQVGFDATEFLAVVDLNTNVIVERTNGRSMIEK